MVMEKIEEKEMFRSKSKDDSSAIFNTNGSAGNNNENLAKILSAYDYCMRLLGWQNDSVASLSNIATQYQASLEAKYHNDFKDIKIAEEIEKRRTERKGISILSQ